MSNMEITERERMSKTQFDAGGTVPIRRGGEKGAMAFNAVALVVAGLLIAAALNFLGDWHRWVVASGILFLLVGVMIAISPRRRHV